ncbi:MAG: hypothetical protein H8E30_15970, partial [Alphaproteobacteria bacterium]|nr:hypothetical protein [Alphaproteobacteria bacterium]
MPYIGEVIKTIVMLRKLVLTIALGALLWTAAGTATDAVAEEVNLYSSRQPFLMKPLLEAFTAETGIKANMAYLKKGMLE